MGMKKGGNMDETAIKAAIVGKDSYLAWLITVGRGGLFFKTENSTFGL
jgi:hypothetical protein